MVRAAVGQAVGREAEAVRAEAVWAAAALSEAVRAAAVLAAAVLVAAVRAVVRGAGARCGSRWLAAQEGCISQQRLDVASGSTAVYLACHDEEHASGSLGG